MIRCEIRWYRQYYGYGYNETIECDAETIKDAVKYIKEYVKEALKSGTHCYTGANCEIYEDDELKKEFFVTLHYYQ